MCEKESLSLGRFGWGKWRWGKWWGFVFKWWGGFWCRGVGW